MRKKLLIFFESFLVISVGLILLGILVYVFDQLFLR